MKRYIYGAGQWGDIFYKVISKVEKINGFIDKYKSGELYNLPILKIKEIEKDSIIYDSVATYEKEVFKDLKGFNIVSFVETLKKYPKIIDEFKKEEYLWLKGRLLDERLNEVRKLLSDKISLEFFEKWVNFRETFDMKYYPHPTNSLKEQYFIDEFKYSKRFVDCGGYVGDTIESYYEFNDGEVISFEPDLKNIEKLKSKVKGKRVLIYPMGVYSETKILRFNSFGSGGSICEDGDILVPVTSLDETIYNFRPNYIKMDIEAAEKKAIIGAKNIIKDFSPKLAISIYHKSEDLWEIPLLMKEINPNYEFKIRCHNHLCIETILYCKVKDD